MTFYRNNVDSLGENLMILPFPGPKSLQLHTINYNALFDDLENSVYPIMYLSNTRSETPSLSRSLHSLPVMSHGSYLVSVAKTLADLKRVNSTVFDLPPDILPFFAKHYTSEFGYLVCKLKEGMHEYEPLCYSHELLSNRKLFAPTLHYHDHGYGVKTETAEWDHMIYSIGTTNMANDKYQSYEENNVEWKNFPGKYQFDKNIPVRCANIEGEYPNNDIIFELERTKEDADILEDADIFIPHQNQIGWFHRLRNKVGFTSATVRPRLNFKK